MTLPRRVPAVAVVVALGCSTVFSDPRPESSSPRRPVAVQQEPVRRSLPALPPRYALRGEDALVRAYEFILDSRFDQVDAELRRACGPAPPEACNVLEATALWWQIQLDPENRGLDAAFTASVERAIRTDGGVDRAGAAGCRGLVLPRRRLRGARAVAGAARREDLRRPRRQADQGSDGAGHRPRARPGRRLLRAGDVQVLRRRRAGGGALPALPVPVAGRRSQGGAARDVAGAEPRPAGPGEADYQLHVIYLWYERQTERAIELLRALQAHYPGNPLYLASIAQIQDAYQHDVVASLETWQLLLAAAREQRANNAALAEVQARLGAARMLEVLCLTDDALEHLKAVTAAKPHAPYSSLALAQLRLGEAHDRLGARSQALSSYKAALAAVPALDPYDVRGQATARIRHAPDPRHAEAYRLSLDGWRRLEKNDLPGASAALERAVTLNAQDPGGALIGSGRVLQARREELAALAQFDLSIRHGRTCPAPILGNAHLEAARLHERLGHKDEALSGYRIASTLFGASDDTHAAATRALARLAR
jgi:tetratricopeptide (TPR) repeat protein